MSDLVERHSGSRVNLTPVAPPEPDPAPAPTGRRAAPSRRHRTTTVPADILVQAQGQPPVERPIGPRVDDGIPTTVADLLGPARTRAAVPDAPRRARQDDGAAFPVDREPHQQPAASYPPAPGRRRAPEPAEPAETPRQESTGRRSLSDDARRRLMVEPEEAPVAPAPQGRHFPTADEFEANRRGAAPVPTPAPGRRARPEPADTITAGGFPADQAPFPADPGVSEAPGAGRRPGAQGQPFPIDRPAKRGLPDGGPQRPRKAHEAPTGRRALPDDDPRREGDPRGLGAERRAPRPPAPPGRRVVAGDDSFPRDPRQADDTRPGEPLVPGGQRPQRGTRPRGKGPVNGTGAHPRPDVQPPVNGLAGPPVNGTGAYPRPRQDAASPPVTGAHPRPRPGGPEGDSYPRPDAQGLPVNGTGAHPRPGGPANRPRPNGQGDSYPRQDAEGLPVNGAHPRQGHDGPPVNGTGSHPRPPVNGTGAYPRPRPEDADGLPPAGTGSHARPNLANAFRRPDRPRPDGHSHPRPGSEGLPVDRQGGPQSYPRPGAEGLPVDRQRRPGPDGDSYPRPDAPGLPVNGTGAHPRPNAPHPQGGPRRPEGDSYPRPGADGLPVNGRPNGRPAGPPPGATGAHPRPPLPNRQRPTGSFPVPGNTGERRIAEGLDGDGEQPPRIPRQQPPGQSSMPPQPPGDEHPDENRAPLMPPPNVPPEELIGLTTEMEPIGEAVQKRRRVDHTLARFSAVHDELAAEEKARKAKKMKLNPFAGDGDELDDHLTGLGQAPGAEPTEVVDFQVDSKSGRQEEVEEARTVRTPPVGGLADQAPEPEADFPTEFVPVVVDEPAAEPVDEAEPAAVEPEAAEESEPEAEAEPEPRRQTAARPPRDRKAKAGRIGAITVAAAIFVATGVGWGYTKWATDSIGDVRALDPNSAAISDAAAQQGDENFLLVGSDSREGAAAEEGVGSAETVPGARSDTVMVAHVPADRSRVVLVSFPRDLEISRPGCERFDAATSTYTGEQVAAQKAVKMNTAYQVGGPLCMTKVVQQLSGLSITRFIGINFDGFKGMVDAVDGVNVCVEKPMYDSFLKTWIVKDAGTDVLLRGNQALDFVRARHVTGDPTSDYGRIKRQQRFLSSLLRKAMSSQVLLDPGKLTSFTGEFARSTFGDNISLDSLLKLGQSLQGLEAGRVTFITVPTVGTANDRGNETLRVDDNKALFQAIIKEQPLPGEQPANAQQVSPQPAPLRQQQVEPVDPKTLKIQVLNGGNSTGGIAKRTAEKLGGFGYTVVQVNAGPSVQKTTIRYGKGYEAQAQTLASSVPGAVLELDPGAGSALVLVLGPEFDGKVTAPGGAAGAPAQEDLPEDLSTVNAGDVTCA